MNNPILSLCMPTNGVIEWVFPVLDSIYKNAPVESQFEVVIEDNGNNAEFEEKVRNYQKKHKNINYYKSSAQGFLCQIDCFKHAQGEFIKFVNHRARLVDGALDYLVEFAENHRTSKPVVFFSNGRIAEMNCNSFDSFVANLKHWSSWSGGLAFWKEDIELITNQEKYNSLFPHTDMLFARRDADNYIIDGKEIFFEIDAGHGAKGKYNLFKAFAVEYISIINDLLRDDSITVKSFLLVKESLLSFLVNCYIDFIVLKQPASYSFDNAMDYLSVFYPWSQIKARILKGIVGRAIRTVFKRR